MNKERVEKLLVIGSSMHQFVECTDWKVKSLPNLVDYDTIIVNTRSLSKKILEQITSARIEQFRKLLTRFLVSSGTLIVISDHYRTGKNKKRYPETYSNYSWSPINIDLIKEHGNTINPVDVRYPKYFSKFDEWEYYFTIGGECLTQELTEYCGDIYNYNYSFDVYPFLQNREKRILAGSYHWWIKPENKPNSKIKRGLGFIILLPLLKNIYSRQAINLLLEDILGKPQELLPPAWTEKVKMRPLDDINSMISSHNDEIEKHQKKISELKKQKECLEYYKKLLYADGSELEEVFKKCLIELGASVNPAKYAEEEYCLRYKKNDYPVEAKGNTKSISLTNLRQLIDYLLIYDEKTGKINKGILIGNAWKNIPHNERDAKDKPVFPSNVVKRAKATNIALISSVDFFEVFCKFLEDKTLGKKILNCIVNSVGIINFKKYNMVTQKTQVIKKDHRV